MHTDDAVILANLPPNAEITITVKLADWLAARAASTTGPEYADVTEVARIVGFSVTYWARLARAGKLAGAVQEGKGGRWKLPLASCRAHIRGLQGRKAAPQRPTLVAEYKPRGPRKVYRAKAQAETA